MKSHHRDTLCAALQEEIIRGDINGNHRIMLSCYGVYLIPYPRQVAAVKDNASPESDKFQEIQYETEVMGAQGSRLCYGINHITPP
jgi:hypothetical protein